MTTHTPQFINDTHRRRFVWAKCGNCTTITEEAYCIDCWEFMDTAHGCGAPADKLVRVEVRAI